LTIHFFRDKIPLVAEADQRKEPAARPYGSRGREQTTVRNEKVLDNGKRM